MPHQTYPRPSLASPTALLDNPHPVTEREVSLAQPFNFIPDWQSFENQGANIAAADLDGDGRPELVVFQIEQRTPGTNGVPSVATWVQLS
jgi:hypothetical protein